MRSLHTSRITLYVNTYRQGPHSCADSQKAGYTCLHWSREQTSVRCCQNFPKRILLWPTGQSCRTETTSEAFASSTAKLYCSVTLRKRTLHFSRCSYNELLRKTTWLLLKHLLRDAARTALQARYEQFCADFINVKLGCHV